MRLCLFILTLALAVPAVAADFMVYAPSRKGQALLIVQASVSAEKGLSLELVERYELGYTAATITQHPHLPLLYISSNRGEDGAVPGSVLHLDADGTVESATATVFEHGYSYLSLDRQQRFLLGNNYGDGHIDIYRLDHQGGVGPRVGGVSEGRKAAHCVLTSPDNRFLYIPYVKDSNALFQYEFDDTSGQMTPLQPKNANPPEGTGPRHMAYHPELPYVYFSNEQGVGASVYRQEESGQLKLSQVCEVVPRDFNRDGVSGSDILITPDGKFLYSGVRGAKQDFDRIACYRVLDDGLLEVIGLVPTASVPWGLALSPDAKYLLVSAFKGAVLTAYQIGSDGTLKEVAQIEWDESISDLEAR